METNLSLRNWLASPITKAFGAVVALGGILKVPVFVAVWHALYATAGDAFAWIALGAFTIAPRVDFLPEGPLVMVALGVGALALTKRMLAWARQFWSTYQAKT